MGRPPWEPTQERIDQVESYAALGLNKEQIADCMGICYDTLNEKQKAFPAFAEALKKGKSKGIARAANLLLKHAEMGSVPSVIFYLKAQAKWSDQNIEEVEKAIKNELETVREMVQRCMQEQGKT